MDESRALNPGKIQNDPILPNPAKAVRKNLLKFADDFILPLWLNQAETIQLNSRKIQNDPMLSLR